MAVEIYAYAKNDDLNYESTELRDFSDGGISFFTTHFDHSYIGQEMKFQLLDDFTLAYQNTLSGRGFVACAQDAQNGEKAWIGICVYQCVQVS
ncbi:MAG: hypothetical protein Q9M19_05305 [Mariprofundaceae bacterium]|nr:hypothetical protein [Mariprofundaceae bacterium]